MDLKNHMDGPVKLEEALLDGDNRWELVRRIIASDGFQRASQLRKILEYTAKLAIVRPNEIPGEFEIAYKVLGRRADFNPANDNIVRAQFSHLRRKLEHYFDTEGREEPLVLTIPKGSYIPIFAPLQTRTRSPAISEFPLGDAVDSSSESASSDSDRRRDAPPRSRNWRFGALVLLNFIFMLLILLFLQFHFSAKTKKEAAPVTNSFVQFLSRSEGDVTIVEPDTSFAMMQEIVGANIPLSEYISRGFPQRQVAMTKDPAKQRMILSLNAYRTTSVNEALIAVDFSETLKRAGVHVAIRYAHDLHVEDLNEGNTVLIGGPNSDPWVTLFTDRINFRHVDDYASGLHLFENISPAPGEQPQYINNYSGQSLGYVDVALTQNLSQSGYVLLINGADMQANEAAARFLLHGRLPVEISSVLARKDVRYFELFLRSKHIAGEADSRFELVAYRIK
jgi:hypothetical protein